MIKRIVVALDPDQDTPIATRYAIRLAKRFDASLTGLAVVDTSNIQPVIGVGSSGTEMYGHYIWEELTEETREVAKELLDSFSNAVQKADVKHRNVTRHGASFEMIVEEMKYHDLLVVGRDSHFFYNEPDMDTKTLANVVKNGVAPTLVVTDTYHDVERLMVAFDGSSPAARSLQAFVHLLPYGSDLDIELVNVPKSNSSEDAGEASVVLSQAESFLKEHHFSYITKVVLDHGDVGKRLLERQMSKKPDLVVMGAHSVSALRRATFGSTTHFMITKSEGPLFLSP
ncbi:MAG: universal stress protein [Balneolaceae bacterium]|nr:universal stress protein [Balneolaceae bacterium]